MTPQDIAIIMGAFGTLLAILGGGAKWLLNHIDTKTKKFEDSEAAARAELSKRLLVEIDGLRADLARVVAEKSLYIRRIYQLEYFIHTQPGINIPSMTGWPPL